MNAHRTALVTGSAEGIGASTARRLSNDGFRVVGVDRVEHESEYLDAGLVANLEDVNAIADVINEAGPVDVLVNNAAIWKQSPFLELTRGDFDETIAVNLRAPLFLCQEVLPHMLEERWGRIINIASVAARTGGQPASTAYGASKAGLLAITKNLAGQYSKYGITINAVAPGGINTTMGSRSMSGDLMAQVPIGRLGSPEEIAGVVSFLTSEAAAFITGATLDVNGGWVMP